MLQKSLCIVNGTVPHKKARAAHRLHIQIVRSDPYETIAVGSDLLEARFAVFIRTGV